jgi:hypothetical protein
MISSELKLKELSNILTTNGLSCYTKLDEKLIDILYDLMINNVMPVITDNTDIEIILYVAHYYNINKDFINADKYYLITIKKASVCSMYNLGCYYYKQKNYIDMNMFYHLGDETSNLINKIEK